MSGLLVRVHVFLKFSIDDAKNGIGKRTAAAPLHSVVVIAEPNRAPSAH
jgi:hypothetical protein